MIKKRKTLDLWRDYDGFIRSLHLKSLEEQKKDKKERLINYLVKLIFIFIASFFTTLTFHFFFNPNGLFNSGINGIIQALLNYSKLNNRISVENFSMFYYFSVLFVNLLMISFVHFFHPEDFEKNSTAIFYILSQFVWGAIFKYTTSKNYLFSKFSPSSWSSILKANQLGFTLNHFFTISFICAIVHSYGYSLIYQVKSTPGGLEIITSSFFQGKKNKKRNFFIRNLTKILSVFIVFLITLFNFSKVEDNVDIVKNQFIRDVNIAFDKKEENSEKNDLFIKDIKNLNELIEEIGKKEKNDLITFNDCEFNNEDILRIFKSYFNDNDLNNENISFYFGKKEGLLNYFKKQKGKDFDKSKINNLELNTYSRDFFGYVKYITNDERLWASLFYILISSFAIKRMFPKGKIVSLIVNLRGKDNLDNVLEILNDFDPVYFKVFSLKNNFENDEDCYIVNCSITKWNYQLLSTELSEFGKILTNEIDESN